MITLPNIDIEDIPMTLINGKPEFASAGKEFFLWNCSLTVSADPDEPTEWKIQRIALVNEDYEKSSHKARRRYSEELTGELFAKAVLYFAERHQYQITDHVIERMPDVLDDAAHMASEFYKVA